MWRIRVSGIAVSLEQYQRTDEDNSHHREQCEFDPCMAEGAVVGVRELGKFGGNDKHATNDRNERNHDERFGNQAVFAERNLHGVEQLDYEENEENLVEEVHKFRGHGVVVDRREKRTEAGDEKRDCGDRQQDTQTDIDDVFDQREGMSDATARRLVELIRAGGHGYLMHGMVRLFALHHTSMLST